MLKGVVAYVIQDHVKTFAAAWPVIIDAIGDLRTKYQKFLVLPVQRRIANAVAFIPTQSLYHGNLLKVSKRDPPKRVMEKSKENYTRG